MSGTLGDLGQLGDGSMQMGFGGGASDPYMMELMRRRAMADALAKQGMAEAQRPMTHWLQPLGSIVQQGVAAWRQGKADDELLNYAKGQAHQRADYRQMMLRALQEGGEGATPTPAPQPQPVAPSLGSSAAPAGGAPLPIAATTLAPEAKALLTGISGAESPGYNVRYGGSTFDSYADHPRTDVPIMTGPMKGQTSSAAGRYQFLGSTWDNVKAKYGLPDFSPASQDLGAWQLARDTYQSKTGRDLAADMKSQDPQVRMGITNALAGVWPSLPGGNQPNGATNGFWQRVDGAMGGAQPNVNVSTATTSPTPSAPPVAAPTAAGGAPAPGVGGLNKINMMRAGVMGVMSGDPELMRQGIGLLTAARAIPDQNWNIFNIGGTMYAVNSRDPNQRIPLGASAEHTPLPQSVEDQKRRIGAPYQEVARTPERQAQELQLRGPQYMNVPPGNAAIGQDGKPVFTNPSEPPKPDKLRSEFIDLTKDFRTIQDAHAKLTASARMSSAAGDLGVIFGIMKMYDPGSTVREGEQATAANAGGVPDRVRAMWNRALTGERLAPDVRADFVNQADILLGQQRRGYDQYVKVYGDLARQLGIDPKQVLPDFVTPGVSASAPAAAANPAPGLADDDIEGGFYRTIQPGSARPSPATQQRVNPANPLGLTLPGGR